MSRRRSLMPNSPSVLRRSWRPALGVLIFMFAAASSMAPGVAAAVATPAARQTGLAPCSENDQASLSLAPEQDTSVPLGTSNDAEYEKSLELNIAGCVLSPTAKI